MRDEHERHLRVSAHIHQKLLEHYRGHVPEYVVDAGKSYITLRFMDDFCNYRDYVITICHIHEFFLIRNKHSESMLSLGGYIGDDASLYPIAYECLQWFKFISPEEFQTNERDNNEQ